MVSLLLLRTERVGGSDSSSLQDGSAALWSDCQSLLCPLSPGSSAQRGGTWSVLAMAPRKRSGRGISFIFCCFRSSDHPEITYRLRNDSSFALQTMEPALPMPPVEELDVMFTELVVSRALLIFSFPSPPTPNSF